SWSCSPSSRCGRGGPGPSAFARPPGSHSRTGPTGPLEPSRLVASRPGPHSEGKTGFVMLEIESLSLSPDRFQEVLDPERYRDFRRALEDAGRTLKGRAVWNVNSTAEGGGVAELLHA